MAENVQNVVTLTVTDADPPKHQHTLSEPIRSVRGALHIEIRILIRTELRIDDSTANPCVVIVTATDTSGNVATQTVSITITDQDEFNVTAPTDSDSDSNTLSEDGRRLSRDHRDRLDADGTTNTVTYDITSQTCSGAFAIGESTGIVTVADTGAIDYETSDSCDLTVRATSADSTSSTTFTVAITDVDDVAPVFTSSDSITLNENVQNVVSFSVTDADTSAAPHTRSQGRTPRCLR